MTYELDHGASFLIIDHNDFSQIIRIGGTIFYVGYSFISICISVNRAHIFYFCKQVNSVIFTFFFEKLK